MPDVMTEDVDSYWIIGHWSVGQRAKRNYRLTENGRKLQCSVTSREDLKFDNSKLGSWILILDSWFLVLDS